MAAEVSAGQPERDDDEFRITRWQLQQVAKYADLERIVWAIINKPVSRPAPVLTEHDLQYHYDMGKRDGAVEERERLLGSRPTPAPDEAIIITNKDRLWCGERCYECSRSTARAATLAENKRVLDDVEQFCKTNVIKLASEHWDSGYNTGIGDVMHHCKSLRQAGEQR